MASSDDSKEKSSGLRPIVFCGPSGVGKGTLIDLLMKRFPNGQFGFSVSHTTRQPREGEVDGVHYHYTTVESIREEIDAGKFIEYAEVHGRYYGTSVKAVESVRSEGKVCVLDIDVQGVQNVKESLLEPVYVFVSPPSMAVLEKRLRGRATEEEAEIQERLGNAAKEMDYGNTPGNFDLVLINDNLERTFDALVRSVKRWYPHLQEAVRPKPIVLCGPLGLDRATLVAMLLDRFPNDQFRLAKPHTTRAALPDEPDNHVFSCPRETMDTAKYVVIKEEEDEMCAISLDAIEDIKASGKICVLDASVELVKKLKQVTTMDPHYMFVAPLSKDALEQELRKKAEQQEQLQSLLSDATTDLQYGQVAGNFDRIFFVANLGATFEDIVHAIKEWYPQLTEVAPEDPQKMCTCVSS